MPPDDTLLREAGIISPEPIRRPAGLQKTGKQAQIVKMADIQPVEVAWLWHPYLPLGKLTLLEGDPSVGKTWLALQIATAISRGWPLPGADGVPRENKEPAPVLYMTAEDGLADTLRPRLDQMGADPAKIYCLTGWRDSQEKEGQITLSDIDLIEQIPSEEAGQRKGRCRRKLE